MKTAAKLAASFLLCSVSMAQAPRPKGGYVPDEETAIQIAKAVMTPMIGKIGIKTQEPFHAELQGDVWEIYGRWSAHPDPGIKGAGGIDMRISKQTGEILGYYFSR